MPVNIKNGIANIIFLRIIDWNIEWG